MSKDNKMYSEYEKHIENLGNMAIKMNIQQMKYLAILFMGGIFNLIFGIKTFTSEDMDNIFSIFFIVVWLILVIYNYFQFIKIKSKTKKDYSKEYYNICSNYLGGTTDIELDEKDFKNIGLIRHTDIVASLPMNIETEKGNYITFNASSTSEKKNIKGLILSYNFTDFNNDLDFNIINKAIEFKNFDEENNSFERYLSPKERGFECENYFIFSKDKENISTDIFKNIIYKMEEFEKRIGYNLGLHKKGNLISIYISKYNYGKDFDSFFDNYKGKEKIEEDILISTLLVTNVASFVEELCKYF